MGDSAPDTYRASDELLTSLARYAPQAIQAISKEAPGIASAVSGVDVAQAPIYAGLYNQAQLAGAGAEAAVAEGPGQRLVTAADKYQRQVDPEAYAGRAAVGQALDKYLSSYDPTRLTPTEEAQISRGIGSVGGSITPSAMQTIRNAQTFGSAGIDRWKNFGDAVSRAAAVLPNLRSGINAFNVATQRGSQETGQGQFAVGQGMGFAQSALGDLGATQRTAMNKKKDTMDMVLAGTQAFANIGQGVGGFMGG